eukprot:scaffold515_cov101-Isochrysis_galbana.AAC.5
MRSRCSPCSAASFTSGKRRRASMDRVRRSASMTRSIVLFCAAIADGGEAAQVGGEAAEAG